MKPPIRRPDCRQPDKKELVVYFYVCFSDIIDKYIYIRSMRPFTMMGQKDNSERTQIEFISLDDLVPENHLVRKIDAAMDFSFIYDEVRDLYKPYGRESMDPVVLIK